MPGEHDDFGSWNQWGRHVLASLDRIEAGQKLMGETFGKHLGQQDQEIVKVRESLTKVKQAAAYSKGKLAGFFAACTAAASLIVFVIERFWHVMR